MKYIDLDEVDRLTERAHRVFDDHGRDGAIDYLKDTFGAQFIGAIRSDDIVTLRDIIGLLDRSILRVDIRRPETDKDRLKAKVHELMSSGHPQRAIDQLYCQFGRFVYDEMSEFAIEPAETVLDKLRTNIEHIVEDHDLTKVGTNVIRRPLDHLDRVGYSSIPYWSLEEADEFDVEKPEPLDEETLDLMIDHLTDQTPDPAHYSQDDVRALLSTGYY